MPFLVRHLWNGTPQWSIDYGPARRVFAPPHLGRETARIEISMDAARLGIDELLRLAAASVGDISHD